MTGRRPRWATATVAVSIVVNVAVTALASVSFVRAGDLQLAILEPFISLSYGVAGAFIALRRWTNLLGWCFVLNGLGFALTLLSEGYATYAYNELADPGRLGELAAWYEVFGWIPPLGIGLLLVFLLFPDGRPLSPRWRWVGLVGAPCSAVGYIGHFFITPPPRGSSLREIETFPLPPAVEVVTYIGVFAVVAAAVSFLIRLHRSRGDERRQLRWLAFSAIVLLLTIALNIAVDDFGSEPKVPVWSRVAISSFFVGLAFVPIAAMVGILKYRLYDIDVVINKAVVYGVLGAFIAAVYVGIVVGIGALVGGGDRPVLSLIATAIIAVAFQPLRERVQRVANRFVYGERATPYEVLSDLSERMSEAMSVDEVLPRMAEAAARAVGADVARVTVVLPGGGERAVTWPADDATLADARLVAEVLHQESPVGRIAVSRASGERFAPSEVALLEDLASQAGAALYNVGLTAQLQAQLEHLSMQAEEVRRSRERIVTARDAERRRMERDIHDGAQQQLVALSVKLGVAQQLLDRDAERAAALLDELGVETTDALEGLRDLARGLFPPLLVEQGLVPALESHVTKHRLPAIVHASAALAGQRFPEQIEVAIYFCCLEALQNASKHAPDAPITIDVALEGGALTFAVRDEGPGYDPEVVTRGAGLQNMEDRLEALGGPLVIDRAPGHGTTVRGRVPARALEPVA